MRWAPLATVAVVLALASPAAAAPTAEEKGRAEVLFREGRALMNAGNYADACGKFEESQRLDPQLGTQLNLALCHSNAGKTASAWAEFREVAEISEKERDKERAQYARQQAAHLEKKLPRLVLRVASPAEGTVIRLDGQVIGKSAWTTALPVDPGEHVVEVSAPAKKTAKLTAQATPAATVEVAIPALEDAPPEPSPAPATSPLPQQPPPTRVETGTADGRAGGHGPVLGYVLGGIGIVGIGVGTVFGLETMAKKKDADAKCPGDVCTPEGHDLEQQARTSSIVSTIGFGVGVVGLAAGTWWLLTSKPSSTAVRVRPSLGGLTVDGRF